MKTLIINLAAIVLLTFAGLTSEANSHTNVRDTGLKTSVYIPESVYHTSIVKKANVVYPGLFTPHVAKSIEYVENFSINRKKYITILYNKSKDFFPQVSSILDQYSIPQEFRVLMAIESGFNGNAVSPAGAVGYWQFMSTSAREYGLKVRMKVRNINYKYTASKKYRSKRHRSRVRKYVYVDERKDLLKSTKAAAQYLRDRCRELNNDWLLVAASYNCGIGNVRKAIKKSGVECATFWDVQKYLPQETQKYVMNFITLNVIFENYDSYEQGTLCFRDQIYAPVETEMNNLICEEDFSTCMADVPCFRF